MRTGFLSILMSATFAVLISLSACSNKPDPAPEVSINPDTLTKQKKDDSHASQQSSGQQQGSGEKHQIEVVIPDNVKGKWEAVKLSILDKNTNKAQDVTIKLGSEYKIPGSEVTLKPVVFLPDFRMDSLTITSISAELNNPAVNVIISEAGKELFKGWLYSKYPDIHPFQHGRFAVVMLEAVKKN
ncbi:DUF2155 domain-containing protein [Candidatus Magnetominusculus dajiuhuensis]|uniref:DUF2155 domain-containing protein n=1 Tax=Candidatus Magnetominusculus dajiuhuensis TaxID=3137712 RepID=UPI003B428729